MNQVLIVDKNKKFKNKYKTNFSLLEKSNFDVKYLSVEDFYNNLQIKFTGYCFIEVVATQVEFLKNFISNNTQTHFYLLLDFSSGEKNNQVTDLFKDYSQIKGFIDYEMQTEFYLPVFSQILAGRKLNHDNDFNHSVKKNLESSVEQLKKNLEIVKDIHSKMVPQREFQVKGLSLKSKFMSGENSGGEFFDFAESNGKLTIVLTSTSSYLVSTLVLSEFSEFTKEKNFSKEALTSFCLNISDQMNKLKLETSENHLDLFIASIDSRTLEVIGHNIGSHDLISLNENVKIPYSRVPFPLNLEKSFFQFNLDRSDSILFLSSGFYRNIDSKEREAFHQRAKNTLRSDFSFSQINQLFFEIKKERKEQFLAYDASCIYLTVDKNAIFEV